MGNQCRQCGMKLDVDVLTHCSDECMFEGIKESKSISDTPVEEWCL